MCDLYGPHSGPSKMNNPEKIVNYFFAKKMLNFGPIFKPFEMLFAELSDKTHHMCNFYVRLIGPAQWSFKDERSRKNSKLFFC